MGRGGAKLPSFCLNKIRPLVKVRSPSIQSKNNAKSVKTDEEKENIFVSSNVAEQENSAEVVKPAKMIGRKIMIVVDSGGESKNALQWALTHTVQSQDIVVLLYIMKPSNQGDDEANKKLSPRVSDFLSSMKDTCKQKRPQVQVEMVVAEGKEKGPAIVEEAKKQGVTVLILGQKKRSMSWRLMMIWAGNRVSGGMVEYCIQNASCMAIAVRRKSKKLGGYLITTKRHKDFWLLA